MDSMIVGQCECGSHYAPCYWSELKKKFVCQLCVGYPPNSIKCPSCKKIMRIEKYWYRHICDSCNLIIPNEVAQNES